MLGSRDALPPLPLLGGLMRRRSAGRPGGQRSGSTRERLGSSDLALWRARASREITGFAVCRLLLQRGARIHRARSYSHHVRWPERRRGRPDFGGFGWHTVWLLLPYRHATEPRKHPLEHTFVSYRGISCSAGHPCALAAASAFKTAQTVLAKKKARRPWIPPAASSARDR